MRVRQREWEDNAAKSREKKKHWQLRWLVFGLEWSVRMEKLSDFKNVRVSLFARIHISFGRSVSLWSIIIARNGRNVRLRSTENENIWMQLQCRVGTYQMCYSPKLSVHENERKSRERTREGWKKNRRITSNKQAINERDGYIQPDLGHNLAASHTRHLVSLGDRN